MPLGNITNVQESTSVGDTRKHSTPPSNSQKKQHTYASPTGGAAIESTEVPVSVRRQLFSEAARTPSCDTRLFSVVAHCIQHGVCMSISMFVGCCHKEVQDMCVKLCRDNIFLQVSSNEYNIDYQTFFFSLYSIYKQEGLYLESRDALVNVLVTNLLITNEFIKLVPIGDKPIMFDIDMDLKKLTFKSMCEKYGDIRCISNSILIADFINRNVEEAIIVKVNLNTYQLNTYIRCRSLFTLMDSIEGSMGVEQLEKDWGYIIGFAINNNLLSIKEGIAYKSNILTSQSLKLLATAEKIENIQLLVAQIQTFMEVRNFEPVSVDFVMKHFGISFRTTLDWLLLPCSLSKDEQMLYQEVCHICADAPLADKLGTQPVQMDCCSFIQCRSCSLENGIISCLKNGGEYVCIHCKQNSKVRLSLMDGSVKNVTTDLLDYSIIIRIVLGNTDNHMNMHKEFTNAALRSFVDHTNLLEIAMRHLVLHKNNSICDFATCDRDCLKEAYTHSVTYKELKQIIYCRGCFNVITCSHHAHEVLNLGKNWVTGLCHKCASIKHFSVRLSQSSSKIGTGTDKRIYKFQLPEFQTTSHLIFSSNLQYFLNVHFNTDGIPLEQVHIDMVYSWCLLAFLDKMDPTMFFDWFGISATILNKRNVIQYDNNEHETASRSQYFKLDLWQQILCEFDQTEELFNMWLSVCNDDFIFKECEPFEIYKFIQMCSFQGGGFFLFSRDFVQCLFKNSERFEELTNDIHERIQDYCQLDEIVYATDAFDLFMKVFKNKTHYIENHETISPPADTLLDMIDIITNIFNIAFPLSSHRDIEFMARQISLIAF
jgi:hypothetical protein